MPVSKDIRVRSEVLENTHPTVLPENGLGAISPFFIFSQRSNIDQISSADKSDISIEPLSGKLVMMELVKHSFLLDIEEREMLKFQFEQLSDLANKPIFFRLDYPRRYEILPQVREAILQHATTIS